MKTSSPTCPACKGADFQLRVMRDEAVAAVCCEGCSANYLLLDSKDYWFDVIQTGYPRLTRCSCKNESFRLRIDYSIRDDGDVDYIEVHSICSACAKTRRQLDFDVDYVGTGHLLKKPLVPCKNPKILYDLKELHVLLTLPDMLRIVDLLGEQGCRFLTRVRRDESWVPVQQTTAEAKATIENDWYQFIYAMPGDIEVQKDRMNTAKKEDALWKRSEVIRISSKNYVCVRPLDGGLCYSSHPTPAGGYAEAGLAFHINFSNEFVRGEKIVAKSGGFREVTASLLALLPGGVRKLALAAMLRQPRGQRPGHRRPFQEKARERVRQPPLPVSQRSPCCR